MAADGTSADVMTAAPDGARPTDVPVGSVPFYLSWDPTSARIGYLGNSPSVGIELGLVDVATSAYAPLDDGSPFYVSWAPTGKQLLVHVGTDRLDRLALDGSYTSVDDQPGTFTAPVWTADGRTLIYASAAESGQRLVAYDLGTGRREVLARFKGTISFVVSPDGRRVAFQVLHGGTVATPLSVIDRKTGTIDSVANEYSPAFFWSPDGDEAPVPAPGGHAGARLVPMGRVGRTARRSPPGASSPASCSAATTSSSSSSTRRACACGPPTGPRSSTRGRRSREAGIWIQPATPDTTPVRLADGVFASWSPA